MSACEPTVRGEIKKARASTHDATSSIMEFIDNAMDAGATRILIDVRQRSSGMPNKILISDNAPIILSQDGMRAVFSWTYERKRSASDTGEYGVGFKSASVNMAEKLTMLTRTTDGRCAQAVADWADMADENRWTPHMTMLDKAVYGGLHPFPTGTTFIMESIRTEILPCPGTATNETLVSCLLNRWAENLGYSYKYMLSSGRLHLELRGVFQPDGVPTTMSVCPAGVMVPDDARSTVITVYRDVGQNILVSFRDDDKMKRIEFVDRRKNGNSVLRVHDVPVDTGLMVIGMMRFRSVHLPDDDVSSVGDSSSSCTLDIVRNGRIIGRDIRLRAIRSEPIVGFVKHEVHYDSQDLNPWLGVSFIKQSHGLMRDHDIAYTIEYLMRLNERRLLRSTPPPPVATATTMTPPSVVGRRRGFSAQTKIRVLTTQEARDGVLDIVMKDSIMPMEYDHKNGEPSENDRNNCQALCVITHSLKTHRPEIFSAISTNSDERLAFLVDLLNCITRSRHLISAIESATIIVRPTTTGSSEWIRDGLFMRI